MRLIYLLGLLLVICSCGDDKKAIEQARFDEVMAIHDEVMPKMSSIRKLKNELQAKAESIVMQDSLGSQQELLVNMVLELEAANESMMVWMRNFSDPEEGTAHEEVLNYYEEEMVKIMKVREQMLGVIEKAESIK